MISHLLLDRASLDKVTPQWDVLSSTVAVILGSGTRGSKQELQCLVRVLGGQVHANPTAETNLIIDADEMMGPQVRGMVEKATLETSEEYDIVTARWLLDCEEYAKQHAARLPLEPRYMRYATPLTKMRMQSSMDEWGDRYAEPATEESLARSSELLRREQVDKRSKLGAHHSRTHGSSCDDVLALDDESFALQQLRCLPDADYAALIAGPTSMLSGVVAYAPRAAIRLRLRLAGARVLDVPDFAAVTHAVLPSSSLVDGGCAEVRQRLTAARLAMDRRAESDGDASAGAAQAKHGYAWLVDESWLVACEAGGRRAEENRYLLCEGALKT